MRTCEPCTDRPTCTAACARLKAVLPTTCNGFSEELRPTSALPERPRLSLSEMERTGSTRLPQLPGFSQRDMRLLHARHVQRLSHAEIAGRFGITERSSRVIMTRLKRKVLLTL
jgi:hypothetical protein